MWLPSSNVARRVVISIALAWTIIIAGLLSWNISNEMLATKEQAVDQARTIFQEFLLTRFWNSTHGGIYVITDERTPPNPYLIDDPLRDITTVDGMILTKMNPSYMTRQISQIAQEQGKYVFNICSLDPIRPENTADSWETKALLSFERGTQEFFEAVTLNNGIKSFKYMGPLKIEGSCLRCHTKYGSQVGDIHGGISITMSADSVISSRNRHISYLVGAYFIIWFFGMLGLWFAFNKIDVQDKEKEIIIHKLEETLGEIKKLSGMLPICSSCNKIRDDKGYWQMLEKYISSHSEAQFSHGICPDCAQHLYPDLAEKVMKKKEGSKSGNDNS